MAYEIEFSSGAARQFMKLPWNVKERLAPRIDDLAVNPRPSGCEKLTDLGAYRIRVGDHRVVYEIDDAGAIVTIATLGHRGDVYRRRH